MKTLYTVIMGFIILEIKTPIPPNVGSGTQSYLLKSTGSFRFKVMNSPIYSIQREVIKKMKL